MAKNYNLIKNYNTILQLQLQWQSKNYKFYQKFTILIKKFQT